MSIRRLLGIALLGAFSLACGPLGPIPGGQLSGELAARAPSDWAFADAHENVQLETRPADPYSVNVWGAGAGGHFYVASGQGGEAEWAAHILANPSVRLRVGDTLYELRALRVTDEAERQGFLAAVKRKYEWEPDAEQQAAAWLFRLEPR